MNIMIVGGTGSLGQKLLERYYKKENRIVVFSRDELKQANLKKKYPLINCIIGDIRQSESLSMAFDGIPYDIVFHCAALKHVDLGEENVSEFVETNYVGTKNLAHFCNVYKAEKLVFFTTDKAVFPINAYGMSKALAEKFLCQQNIFCRMNIYIFRWGNILGSRGSVLDYFKKCFIDKQKLKITDLKCTRFWLLLDEAIDFVIDIIEDPYFMGVKGVHIPFMKAASLEVLAKSVYHVLKNRGHDLLPFEESYVELGLRPGEKFHENMFPEAIDLTSEDCEAFTMFELMQKIERII